jgi:hypothetical protein
MKIVRPEDDCLAPLPDGSPCHICRIFEVLIEAEKACGNDGEFDDERCALALQAALAYFVAALDDSAAMAFAMKLYGWSRERRAELITELNPLDHTAGNA